MNNPHNILITKEDIQNILNYFGPIGGLIGNKREYLYINNLDIYQQAFVHESYFQAQQQNTFENEPIYVNYFAKKSNETLEYLGDHALKTWLGKYLYNRYDNEREGFLTKLKIKIEKCSMLHKFAITLGFKKFLLLSLQIENQTLLDRYRGRNTLSYYEDAFEAFLGSIMEDFGEMGYIYGERFIINIIENIIDFSELISTNDNFKDSLQRYYQSNKFQTPIYSSIDEQGPIYRKVFTRILYISKEQFSQLDDLQQVNIINYTKEILKYYQHLSLDVYTMLLSKLKESKTTYILCIGSGQKIIISEQLAAKNALINLNLSLEY
jgi:dsRNA-specific ribonuclease